MKPTKVLHIFGKMDRGGAEMRTLDLLRELQVTNTDLQIEFHFCVLSGQGGELDDEIRQLGGTVHFVPLKFGFASRFKKLLRDENYTSVHSHVHLFSGYLLKVAHTSGVPSRICHLHTTGGYGNGEIRKKIQNWFMKKWLSLYATDLIAVSHGVKDVFLNHAGTFKNDARLQVIYDAVRPQAFARQQANEMIRHELGLKISDTLMVHVGRLDPVKNHKRLLQIFSEFVLSDPTAHLVLVGKTELQALGQLRAQAESLKVTSRIHFIGSRDNVHDYLSAANLMIFPSIWEGLPGAVLEAGVVGLPVLATDLSGCRELAAHFNSIRVLPLSQDNDVWVRHALEMKKSEASSSHANMEILCASPFSVENALAKLVPLWRGAVRRP